MNSPQTIIQQSSAACSRIGRALLAHAEMLSVARPDSTIVAAAQVSLRRLAVELDNSAVELQGGLMTNLEAE
ncbi:hypothetical protein [Burkholderia gladioli]|uniref:hypothetical protein n=1 Tax=Burkholderia gladioli TaxID=28095 RepID=UPI00163E39E2|nr:hypothetical protein [Burkholderia gladioli]